MRSDPLGIGIVRDAGFRVVEPEARPDFDYPAWLTAALREAAAEALIIDVRDDLSLSDLRTTREQTGARILVLDDVSERRLAADDVFYPPVPQVQELEWPHFAGRVHVGWDWVALRAEFAAEPRRSRAGRGEVPVVLVSMGGSDPGGLSLLAARVLPLVTTPIELVLLVGRGFRHDAELAPLLKASPHRTAVVRDGDIHGQMLAADLALLSFGVTAYEAAACALPAILLCLTEDHAASASSMDEAGIAESLGLAGDVSAARLAGALDELAADPARRVEMGRRGRSLVDGRGAARIAEISIGGSSRTE
jgi:spore coat polysaccharide biosynthesis protein SpsF